MSDMTKCFCCGKDLPAEPIKDEEGHPYCRPECKKHVEEGHPEKPGVCEFC